MSFGHRVLGFGAGAAVAGALLLLDKHANCEGAWCPFRQVRAAYSGFAIKARRSSDDATCDVKVPLTATAEIANDSSAGDPDGTAFSTWYDTDSVFVEIVYDHSTIGNNVTQTTNSLQPRIVNAGTFDGKIVPDGTDDFFSLDTGILLEEKDFTYFHRCERTAGTNTVGLSKGNSARATTMRFESTDVLFVTEGRMMKATGQTQSGELVITTQWDLAGCPDASCNTPIIRIEGTGQTVVQHVPGSQSDTMDSLLRSSNLYDDGSFYEAYWFRDLKSGADITDIETTLGV